MANRVRLNMKGLTIKSIGFKKNKRVNLGLKINKITYPDEVDMCD